jgi:DNA-binding beta-propeller fold protein YncE
VGVFNINGDIKTMDKLNDIADFFIHPHGLSVDKQTNRIFVVHEGKSRVHVFDHQKIYIPELKTDFESRLGSNGPFGITIIQQKIFITDRGNHRIQVFSLENYQFLYTIGRRGNKVSEFSFPSYITSSSNWNDQDLLFVADDFNYRVQVLSLEGRFITKFSTNKDSFTFGIAVGSNYIYTCQDNFIYIWK